MKTWQTDIMRNPWTSCIPYLGAGFFLHIILSYPNHTLHYPIMSYYPPLSYRLSRPYSLFHLWAWQSWGFSWTSCILFATFSLSYLLVFIHWLITTFCPYFLPYHNLLSLSLILSQPLVPIPYPFLILLILSTSYDHPYALFHPLILI